MKSILTGFLLCFLLSGFAQNYAPFYSTSDEFYEENNNFGTTFPLEKALIDSVQISGQDSIFYPFKKLGSTLNTSSTINPCYNLYVNSWMGSQIFIGNDTTIFYNNNNEPISLNHSAKVGDSSILHSDGVIILKTYMVAKVYQNIPGIGLDSIKKFIILTRNSLGRPLNSQWEDDTLMLSKNHGLVSSYRWNIFPATPHHLQPIVSANYLRIDEVYDFNIGDIFHYSGENSSISNITNITISDKWISANNDTLYYERQVAEEIQDPSGTIINTFSDTIFYTDLDSLLNSPLIPNRPNRLSANELTTFSMSRDQYNNRQFEEVVTYDHQVTVDSNCYSPQSSPQVYLQRVIRGVGSYSSLTIAGNTTKDSLVYFKKGNETWGNPHLITGIDNSKQLKNSLELFPNPTRYFITVTSSSNITMFKVFTLEGKLVSESSLNSSRVKIDLPEDLGVYFIQLVDAKGNSTQHKVIKR
jgi:hypothetical protein